MHGDSSGRIPGNGGVSKRPISEAAGAQYDGMRCLPASFSSVLELKPCVGRYRLVMEGLHAAYIT